MKSIAWSLMILLVLVAPLRGEGRVAAIPAPQGYTRIVYPEASYSHYLRHLPLKPDQRILRYDGKRVWGLLYRIYAVVDKPLLFKADLEQCADFSMRLWADYHRDRGRLEDLYLFDYNGRRKYFRDSRRPFEKYLRWHMAYSNSYSIKKGARRIEDHQLQPGDMFVQNTDGGVGHVSVIVDAAQDARGERAYLIGFSFMPAQEFHIEKAARRFGPEGWFTPEGYRAYLADFPFSRYGEPVLRRFD